ncbi:hypothetical protein [Deinococcus yavapaiensis]|uniref:Nuf2 DHR10-like domain-containing protein n=1 Tax=Deinococcus yavapaiensis KR-236 TaxID=694435 RepID=A0A318S9X9_9DEIO|nr:hypothetical protein [Deinococcus yavapaiensis]PYE53290.1 hypothetical protein DES52_10962 [Deinococcus yavapaiensis KR-236]
MTHPTRLDALDSLERDVQEAFALIQEAASQVRQLAEVRAKFTGLAESYDEMKRVTTQATGALSDAQAVLDHARGDLQRLQLGVEQEIDAVKFAQREGQARVEQTLTEAQQAWQRAQDALTARLAQQFDAHRANVQTEVGTLTSELKARSQALDNLNAQLAEAKRLSTIALAGGVIGAILGLLGLLF